LKEVEGLVNAANGLSRGVDWNKGTHAKEYRGPLLQELKSWHEKFGGGEGDE
jgi:hypothetical protein